MQHNRQILDKVAKKHFKRIAKGFDAKPINSFEDKDLDVIAGLHDQNLIFNSYRVKRSVRRAQRTYFTPTNPLLPLRMHEEAENFSETDSSDEEQRQIVIFDFSKKKFAVLNRKKVEIENHFKELDNKKKRSPFDDCYLCKLEPGFQHLHVLGNIFFRTEDPKEESGNAADATLTLPEFYKNYGLFVGYKFISSKI